MGVVKGDTRSLDYSSYRPRCTSFCIGTVKSLECTTASYPEGPSTQIVHHLGPTIFLCRSFGP